MEILVTSIRQFQVDDAAFLSMLKLTWIDTYTNFESKQKYWGTNLCHLFISAQKRRKNIRIPDQNAVIIWKDDWQVPAVMSKLSVPRQKLLKSIQGWW